MHKNYILLAFLFVSFISFSYAMPEDQGSPIDHELNYSNLVRNVTVNDSDLWNGFAWNLTRWLQTTGGTMSGNIDMNGNNISNVSDFFFNTNNCVTDGTVEGRICWDPNKNTMSISSGLGTVLQVGQEMTRAVKNKAGQTIYAGQVVFVSGSSGELETVKLADASNGSTLHNLAMVTQTSCNDNAECQVTSLGLVHDIDTSAFTQGDDLYLTADGSGNVTTTAPNFPNYNKHLGTVTRSHASTGMIAFYPEIDWNDGVTVNSLGILTNLTVLGNGNFSGDIYIDDGKTISLGNQEDFEVYFNGTDTILRSKTGEVVLVLDGSDSNMSIKGFDDGLGNNYAGFDFNDPANTRISILDGGYFAFINDYSDMWLGTTGDPTMYFNYYNGLGALFGWADGSTQQEQNWYFYDQIILGTALGKLSLNTLDSGYGISLFGGSQTQVDATSGDYRFASSTPNTDLDFYFNGTSNSGQYSWMEDEDYFKFWDNIYLDGSLNLKSVQLYDDGSGALMLDISGYYLCFDIGCNYYVDASSGYSNLYVDYAGYADYADYANSAGTASSATNADKVDNIHASTTPTANYLYPLNADGNIGLTKSIPKILATESSSGYSGGFLKNSTDNTIEFYNEVDALSSTPYAISLDGTKHANWTTQHNLYLGGYIEFWAKDIDTSSDGYIYEATDGGISAYFSNVSGYDNLVVNGTTGVTYYNVTTDDWTFFILSNLNSNGMDVYINNVLQNGSRTGGTVGKAVKTFFADNTGNNELVGKIDAFAIGNYFNGRDWDTDYNNGAGNYYTGGSRFFYYYNFDEGSGATSEDIGTQEARDDLTFNSAPTYVTSGVAQNLTDTTATIFRHYQNGDINLRGYLEIGDTLMNLITIVKDTLIQGDLNVTGNFTGNQIYVEGYGVDIGEVSIASSGVYYNITNFTMGLTNGFSFNGGSVIPAVSGVYKIDGSWSFSGTPSNEYHIAVAINGTVQNKCHAERVIGTGGDVGNAGVTCFLNLNAGDKLTTMIENVDSSGNPTIHNINFNAVRIGN